MKTIILGAGPAGYVCAIRAAQLGEKVLVIDAAGEYGGVCLNRGCIPSKALIHASSVYDEMKHAKEFGVSYEKASLDLAAMMSWKEGVVGKLTQGVAGLLKANGVTYKKGKAKFLSPGVLDVAGERITYRKVVIATGSSPRHIFPIDQEVIVDSTGALHCLRVPKNVVCIGGGYIGLELGTFYSKIGSHVTVLEAGARLLNGMDPDLTAVVQKKLEKRGVQIILNAKLGSVTRHGSQAHIELAGEILKADRVLVTVGRVPNTSDLGLASVGITLDAAGFIPVNASRQTVNPDIYAIGDVAGQPLLAHKGSKEGLVAAEAIAGKKTVYDVKAMPAVVFTDPEIATVGFTADEVKTQGRAPDVSVFPFAANGRALSLGETDGFVKIISHAGIIEGVHIVGPGASNLIAEAALAIEIGARVEDLSLTVHPHPTLSEALMEAAEVGMGHPIHIFKKK